MFSVCTFYDHSAIYLILLQNGETPLKLGMVKGQSGVVSYIKRLQEHHTGTADGDHEVCLYNISYDVYE